MEASLTLRDDQIDAILGRARIPYCSAASAAYAGKRVLITGAAGSIGRALAKRLSEAGCSRLVLLDANDHGLIEAMDAIDAPLLRGAAAARARASEALCDVRNLPRLTRIFEAERPDVVFHAAALKHVHFGDRHPVECILTNLMGAINAIDALDHAGGGRFVLVSTDKAASPVSVMGAAKRLAELYVRTIGTEQTRVQACAVRFGNVFASRGSVAEIFARQIAAGGPVHVTDARMERYFMRLAEAVELLLIAGDTVSAEKAPMLLMDMGDPLPIIELARRMIAALAPGRDIPITFTGLREGEKLSEQLIDEHERMASSSDPFLWRIEPAQPWANLPAKRFRDLCAFTGTAADSSARTALFALLDDAIGQPLSAAG